MSVSKSDAAVNENRPNLIGLALQRDPNFRRVHDRTKVAFDRLRNLIKAHPRNDDTYSKIYSAIGMALAGWANTIADLTVANRLLDE